MLKRFTPQLALLVIICLIAAFGYVRSSVVSTNTVAEVQKTVIIDAGHGGLTNTIKV